jgi:ATP-dependent RNA helicase DeaD
LFHWVNKLENVATDHKEIEKFLPEIEEKLAGLNREEIIKRVVSLEFDRFLDDYRSGEDLIAPVNDKDGGSGRSGRRESREEYPGNYTRLFINQGKTDGFFPDQLIELINQNTKGKKVPIGKIDLLKSFSFFEVPPEFATELIVSLNDSKFNGRRVAVEIAQEKTDKQRQDDNQGSRPAKWSDRRPDKKKGDRGESYKRDFKKDKKRGNKDKKKYSR